MKKPKTKLKLSKKTIYQIDQSGKIEQTERNPVIALTNGKNLVLVLKAKSKRLIWEVFKNGGRKNLFPYLVFAAMLALVLKEAEILKLVLGIKKDWEFQKET